MSTFVQPRPSAAIRIVAPSETTNAVSSVPPSESSRDHSPSKPPPNQKKVAKCRNILIHGFCKNEGKGCIYDHLDSTSPPASSSSQIPRLSSPVLSASTVNVNAPVFVPKAAIASAASNPNIVSSPDPFKPAYLRDPSDIVTLQDDASIPYFDSAEYDMSNALSQVQLASSSAYAHLDPTLSTNLYGPGIPNGYVDPRQGYYAPIPAYIHQPLNYHLYTQLPYLPPADPSSSRLASHRFFLSDVIREDLQRRSEAIYAAGPPQPPPQSQIKGLPEEVHTYHSLVPLEDSGTTKERRKWFLGCLSVVYRATRKDDGSVVVLRRIEGFRLTQESAFASVEAWSKSRHPNIVHLREAFTTRAFGDYSLVFVYDFHPTAQTLYQLHVASSDPNQQPLVQLQQLQSHHTQHSTRYGRRHRDRDQRVRNGGSNTLANGSGGGSSDISGAGGLLGLVDERILWSILVQIANAMKDVHERGLAMRTLDVSKVIVTGKNRIRVNCCGIFDVLSNDPRANIEALQQDDLLAFGRLVLALCTRNTNATANLSKAMETISRQYSPDVKNVVLFLISKPAPNKIIDQLLDMFGTRLLTEMNALASYGDQLEGELMSELENARVVRLMAKLGFINERPEFSHDIRWSETGDRYIISLFRDYVFHQVDETGHPVVDLTHVITCLNKLDVGTDERIMLVSRDEQTCLVVSFKEIKACIESAFGELAPRGHMGNSSSGVR